MQRLKLIWDFRGAYAIKTAKHHEIHLKQYAETEKLTLNITGIENLSDMHAVAFLVVIEPEMPKVRDALKPHRGKIYSE